MKAEGEPLTAEQLALSHALEGLGLLHLLGAVLKIRRAYQGGGLSVEGVFHAVRPACLLEVDAVRLARVIVEQG